VLTLSEAKKSGRLEEFIAQQEAAAIGPIEIDEFRALAETLIKAPPPKDQTSRSASGENSTGEIPIKVLRADMDMRSVH
jgi:hypothetical protein